MTRVTDEDLEVMVAMCACHVTMDNESLLGDAVRAELLALRKVADAAAAVYHADIATSSQWGELGEALAEVGL